MARPFWPLDQLHVRMNIERIPVQVPTVVFIGNQNDLVVGIVVGRRARELILEVGGRPRRGLAVFRLAVLAFDPRAQLLLQVTECVFVAFYADPVKNIPAGEAFLEQRSAIDGTSRGRCVHLPDALVGIDPGAGFLGLLDGYLFRIGERNRKGFQKVRFPLPCPATGTNTGQSAA